MKLLIAKGIVFLLYAAITGLWVYTMSLWFSLATGSLFTGFLAFVACMIVFAIVAWAIKTVYE